MKRSRVVLAAFLALGLISNLSSAEYPFVFKDVGDSVGLYPGVAGIRAHGAAWGDADGDGYPDLYVATFNDAGSKESMFFRNNHGKFTLDGQKLLRVPQIGSGALFVDLTNNGRLDLYFSNCAKNKTVTSASKLFRNEGGGKFTEIVGGGGACPANYEGRGLTALDYDGDGLLDLATCEQYYSANVKTGARLYRNLGNHKFEDVTEKVGLPAKLGGVSICDGDVNNDSWPDLFLSQGDGDHRLFLNDGHGKFIEAPGTREIFHWEISGGDNIPAGTAIGDVNRDGWQDIVIGNHYKTPWVKPAPIKLYLNRGMKNGKLVFEDVSAAAGVTPLQMKAPHVEIQDFDNDGWPDIFVSIVKFKADKTPCPVIFKNLGAKDGLPRFCEDAWAVNGFPTAEDLAAKGTGKLFDKVIADKSIIYMAPAPTADFDRDGKVDIFLANWWINDPSLLLRNETPGGNWLEVCVTGKNGVNRMGVGSRVNVYPAGKLKDAASLLGSREISIGQGYCSGQEAVAHFGLGSEKTVDLEIILPCGKGSVERKAVAANQRLTVAAE